MKNKPEYKLHQARIRDLKCSQRCSCHPESHMVVFRDRNNTSEPGPLFQRPAFLGSFTTSHQKNDNCRAGVKKDCCANIRTEPMVPFPIVNECRGACSVEIDLHRYLRKLYQR